MSAPSFSGPKRLSGDGLRSRDMWAASALSGVSSDIFNYGHALAPPGEKFNDLVEATEYDCADENRGKVHYLYGFYVQLTTFRRNDVL